MVKAQISITKKQGPPMGYGDLPGIQVLVGIPSGSSRKGEGITNAQVLFIFSKGSPLKGIPARPLIEPAVEANMEVINVELGNAVSAALNNDPEGVTEAMTRAGLIAENACKDWFFDSRNGWAPNALSTIVQKGSKVPGIDTGAMRRALTSVVKGKFSKRAQPATREVKLEETEGVLKAARARGESEGRNR